MLSSVRWPQNSEQLNRIRLHTRKTGHLQVLIRLWLVGLFLVCLCALLAFPSIQPSAQEELSRGESFQQRYLYTAALASYLQALRLDSQSALPYIRLGELYLLQHKFSAALPQLKIAQRLAPNAPLPILLLARDYAGLGQQSQMEKAYLRLIQLDPANQEAHYQLGLLYEQQLRLQAANDEFALVPENDLARYHFALLELHAGQLDAARALFLGLANGASNNVLRSQARIFVRLGDISPANPIVAELLATSHLALGVYALADREFQVAALAPELSSTASAYRGYLAFAQGKKELAKILEREALRVAPHNTLAAYYLGSFALSKGTKEGLEEAKQYFIAAVKDDQENAAAWSGLGQCLAIQGDYLEAEQAFNRAAGVSQKDPAIFLVWAHFYSDHRYRLKGRVALQAALTAYEVNPASAEASDVLGWVSYLSNQPLAESLPPILRAIHLDQTQPLYRYHLAVMLAAHQRSREALLEYRRAVDLDTTGEVTILVRRDLHGLLPPTGA